MQVNMCMWTWNKMCCFRPQCFALFRLYWGNSNAADHEVKLLMKHEYVQSIINQSIYFNLHHCIQCYIYIYIIIFQIRFDTNWGCAKDNNIWQVAQPIKYCMWNICTKYWPTRYNYDINVLILRFTNLIK